MNPDSQLWWQHCVVYQLYVRSFSDSNGDGIGDLEGIRQRLGYLAELGVDAIWLNPCYPSPQADHGYDVADYFDIDPAYGDLDTFDRLLAEARALGIRIIMDVVPNHCSEQHEWFVAALAAGAGSPERDRFYFRDGKGADGEQPPNNWRSIFGGSAWDRIVEPDGSLGQWYLHVFAPQQPDMNWNHHDVPDYFDRMLRFWFDRGVDGIRADAVTHLGKAPGLPDEVVPEGADQLDVGGASLMYTWQPEGHVAWKRWRRTVDAYQIEHPEREVFIVAEAHSGGNPEIQRQYVNDTEFHQSFAFDLMGATWRASSFRRAIEFVVGSYLPFGLAPAWTLNNHDAQRSVTRYGRTDAVTFGDDEMNQLHPSTAPVDVVVGTRRALAAAMLELSLPGSVYLYAGEELGLPEVLDLPASARQDPVFHRSGGAQPGRDGCRVPLPWKIDESDSFGFSTIATEAAPWIPQPTGWGGLSVEQQSLSTSSALSVYRHALAVRRELVDLQQMSFEWLESPSAEAIAFARGKVVVVSNFGETPITIPVALVGDRSVSAASSAGHLDPSVVPPETTVWLS